VVGKGKGQTTDIDNKVLLTSGLMKMLGQKRIKVTIPVWIIQESWGKDWGHDGYMAIKFRCDRHMQFGTFENEGEVPESPLEHAMQPII